MRDELIPISSIKDSIKEALYKTSINIKTTGEGGSCSYFSISLRDAFRLIPHQFRLKDSLCKNIIEAEVTIDGGNPFIVQSKMEENFTNKDW